MTPLVWLAFLVAAGLGAPTRFVVDSWVGDRFPEGFPWGTLTVNATGCFLLGILAGLSLYHGLDTSTGTVLGVGALGAYTTFSTFTVETIRLLEDRAVNHAFRNIALTTAFGLLTASAGLLLTSILA